MIFNERVMGDDDKKYNFDDYSKSSYHSENNIHAERRIFKQHMYGGPKGLGDPTYRELSKMEEDPMIPQRMRDITRTQLCTDVVQTFSDCAKDNGFFMFYYCRGERDKMMECQMEWFDKPQFQEAVKEEYLNERSHFRESGVKTKRYHRGTFIKRDLVADPPLDKDGNYRPQKPCEWDASYPEGDPAWTNFKFSRD